MKYYPPRYLFRRYEILKHIKRGGAFLEVGPGNLYLSQELLRFYDNGTLIEYNPEVQSLYSSLPPESRIKLELKIADFQTGAIEGSFDCVVACEVMEHVKHDGEFLRKLIDLIAPGGQLVLSVPAHMRFWSTHDESVGHFKRYERRELLALLREYEFKSIEMISYGFPFTNMFRIPRVILAKLYWQQRLEWDQKKQTQESGLSVKRSNIAKWLGLPVNPVTVYPLCKFAALFNDFDLSDGYLVIAEKR